MPNETLLALAERCEREQGNYALECAIADAVGTSKLVRVPNYTTSLDAAVTLVPRDCWRETNGPRRSINIPSPAPNFWHCNITVWEQHRDVHGWAATEAMAICAAALRARANAP